MFVQLASHARPWLKQMTSGNPRIELGEPANCRGLQRRTSVDSAQIILRDRNSMRGRPELGNLIDFVSSQGAEIQKPRSGLPLVPAVAIAV